MVLPGVNVEDSPCSPRRMSREAKGNIWRNISVEQGEPVTAATTRRSAASARTLSPCILRAFERRHEAGEAHEPLESLVDAPLLRLGARVLARFDCLSRDDHDAVYEAARSRPRGQCPCPLGDARIGHAVLTAASALDLRLLDERD